MWYDKGQLLSFRKLLNFLVGHRGVGKSYDFKKWCLNDFIKNGNQFIWVRRYKTELKKLKNFYDDIFQEFKGHKLEIKGNEFLIDGKTSGWFLALSISTSFKSVPFPKVDKIVFDEFLIDKTTYRYLSDEVYILLDLVETVFRSRDNVRGVFLIGNNITWANPYFLHFKVPIMKNRRFWTSGEICVESFKDQEFIDKKLKTRFGRLVSENARDYMEYAIENKSLLDNDTFIERRPPQARFKCCIQYNGKTYGFWLDNKNGLYYCSKEYDPYTRNIYTLTREDHTPNALLIKNVSSTYIKDIVWCFRTGNVRFDDIQVKSVCFEMFSYFVR